MSDPKDPPCAGCLEWEISGDYACMDCELVEGLEDQE